MTSFDGHTSNVTALGFHRDGQWMFTGSEDKTIKVWDLRHAAVDARRCVWRALTTATTTTTERPDASANTNAMLL